MAMTKKKIKKEVKEWFWRFRPDMKINEIFIENLYNEYISRGENLSLDERGSFYAYIVFNYKSEMLDLIYSILEGKEKYNAILESWVEENRDVYHIGKIMELIEENDPIENDENYPHLDFSNDKEVKVEYLKLVRRYLNGLITH